VRAFPEEGGGEIIFMHEKYEVIHFTLFENKKHLCFWQKADFWVLRKD